MSAIRADNARVLRLLSWFLNLTPTAVTREMMDSMCSGADDSNRDYAYASIVAASCGLMPDIDEADKMLFRRYFVPMIERMSPSEFQNDPYYSHIRIEDATFGEWTLRNEAYLPYEAFVSDELQVLPNGRLRLHIGYFEDGFVFPAVLQNGREWMTVTPHEVRTIRRCVQNCAGRVLTYGLGLGYFAYLAALREDVASVTVVERDPNIISLFCECILPQMSCRDRIRIIEDDALDFAKNGVKRGGYDCVFADLWHDASDGVELYCKLKDAERFAPDCKFYYWIENTLKYYMT